MSKRPTDHLEPAAKKRTNDRQLTKDDDSEEDEEVSLCLCLDASGVKLVSR
jgi:hypothetical protein